MYYAISEIKKIIGAQYLQRSDVETSIDEIFFDTRKGSLSANALFIAIDGKNTDGHQHIDYAYNHLKTRNFIVSKKINTDNYKNANFLQVENVIVALQKLAIHHRNLHSLLTIGITGSNGKTIVKEWIYQLTKENNNIVRSPGSYNSQLGVPISVLLIQNAHNLGLFESGISTIGEMSKLAQIIQPKIGIITNLGPAHSAGFSDDNEKLIEKIKLFADSEVIIYCADKIKIHEAITSKYPNKNLIAWSYSNQNSKYHINKERTGNHTTITINRKLIVKIPFIDVVSIENAIFSIIAALEIGTPEATIITQSPFLKTIHMRLEIKNGINNCTLINDSYNSDIFALSSALNILNQQEQKKKNTLIFSQIEESNLEASELNSNLASIISENNIQKVIALGPKLFELDDHLKDDVEFLHYNSTQDLIKNFQLISFQNENILIKGARSFSLEKIFELLSVKVHQTFLNIDLEAMRHNLSVYRSHLQKNTKIMVVLKASAYGSGSVELARFLSFQHIDYIAVAYIDEGIELRNSGIKIPIMVMNPEEAGFSKMIQYQLEPEIYSLKQLTRFTSFLQNESYKIHLKIETGMNRLGFEQEDCLPLCNFLAENKNIHVESIFSHLVGSDDQALDSFSQLQAKIFIKAYTDISKRLKYQPNRHILNSNGISRFPELQYEMVRLGIGLHGLSDDPKVKKHLQKVQTLKTRIAQIKHIKKGDSVGYNRKFVAEKSYTSATINIGYADGFPRNAGNGNYSVLVKGHSCQIIGNVCMDMSMVDVTGLHVTEGDEVILFGPTWPIEILAKQTGTIPYEILTRLSARIHRIFSRE